MKDITLKTASIRWCDNFSMEVCGYDNEDKFFCDSPKMFDITPDGTLSFECYTFRFTLEQTSLEFINGGVGKFFRMANKQHRLMVEKCASRKMSIRALAMVSYSMKRAMAAAYRRNDFDEAHLCRVTLRENAIRHQDHVESLKTLKHRRHAAALLVGNFHNILTLCKESTK